MKLLHILARLDIICGAIIAFGAVGHDDLAIEMARTAAELPDTSRLWCYVAVGFALIAIGAYTIGRIEQAELKADEGNAGSPRRSA